MTKCDEIIIVLDIVSAKKANTVATNFTNTASINCHSKKVRDLRTVLLLIILLLIITIICYHYEKKCTIQN